MPNSHRPPENTTRSCLRRVRRCELSRPVSECVRRSHRQCLRRPTHSDAERTCQAVGPTQFTPPHQTRQDGPVCVVSGAPVWIERVQTSNFLSATVLTCRESNSRRRSGRDSDKTVLSCLAWRCELALSSLRMKCSELPKTRSVLNRQQNVT